MRNRLAHSGLANEKVAAMNAQRSSPVARGETNGLCEDNADEAITNSNNESNPPMETKKRSIHAHIECELETLEALVRARSEGGTFRTATPTAPATRSATLPNFSHSKGGGRLPLGATSPGVEAVQGRAFGGQPQYLEQMQQRQAQQQRQQQQQQQGLRGTPNNYSSHSVLLEATLVADVSDDDQKESNTTNTNMDDSNNTSAQVLEGMVPLEVESSLVVEAAPVETKRYFYYCTTGLFILIVAVAVVIVLVVTGTRDQTSSGSTGPTDLTEILAYVPKTICFERAPGSGESEHCDAASMLEQGGGVGNIVAQSFLDYVEDADIAIQNSGSVRADILAGDFTRNDAYNLLPFKNLLYSMEMLGSEIKLVMEQGLHFIFNDPNGNNTGAYPYTAGLRFAVDMRQDFGNRLVTMLVQQSDTGVWTELDPNATYTVVANSYLLGGGDNYTLFQDVFDPQEEAFDATEVFMLYAQKEGELLDPLPNEYSTISYVPP